MLRKTSFFICVMFLAASLGAVSAGLAETWPLVDDFDINVNSTTSTWSYGYRPALSTDPISMTLLDINTVTMQSIFASDTAQSVWGSTETSWAYWMLGKNTGTTAIHDLWGETLDFQPGTVMLYPGQENRNLLVSWLAPSDMIVDANWTFTRVSARRPDSPWTAGQGTDYRLTLRNSTGDTTVEDFAGVARPGGDLYDSYSSAFSGLTVHAGDRLFWEITGFNGTVDVCATGAAITIAQVPEPSTLALLAAGLVGLLAYAWRMRRDGTARPPWRNGIHQRPGTPALLRKS